MTLRARLLLATFVLSLATTLILSFGLRTAWQRAEATRFEQEFEKATRELVAEIRAETNDSAEILGPVCAHDPLVDSALIGLVRGDLGERLLSIRLRVPELERALRFDELALVTDRGEILGGRAAAPEGEGLARELLARLERSGLGSDATPGSKPASTGAPRGAPPEAFVVACQKKRGTRWVGLLGARRLEPYLARAEARHALALDFDDGTSASSSAAPRRGTMSRRLELPELGGRTLVATRSRLALADAVRTLDLVVVVVSLAALAFALVLAALLTRGLARPVVDFALRARQTVRDDPEPLPETGGPELAEAARAFNQTLADLRALRDRLAITEKIAARREVARQIAHEIKNPLSPIRSAIETLRRLRARGAAEFDEYFDEATRTVLTEVHRISELVKNFSEYASLPSPKPSEFDLFALTREIVRLHEGLGAELLLEAGAPLEVVADRDQITQVLTNLVKNALEATRGSAAPTIVVRVAEEEWEGARSRVVEVRDNGPGVPDDLKNRVFEPYLTTKKEGSGLGLAISRRIAVEHGGDLVLADTPSGAAFRLVLPSRGPPLRL